MPDFLDHWVARPDDEAGKNWVAKALVDAFPEPWISNEFTHARAALAPIHDQLVLRADRCKGQVLDPQGWKREQPLLALAATVANKGFVRTGGRDGRTLLFRVIVELIAYNPGHAGLRGLKEYAHALRIELEALDKNPHSRPPNPDFATALDAIPWFGQQLERYPDAATTAWRRELSALLRQALLNPAPPPGITSDDDEDVGGDVVAVAPSWTDTELVDDEGGFGVPPSYWLVSENDFGPRAGWDEGVREEVLGASLSTYIPLGRFTEASPTYLTDQKAKAEAGLLMAYTAFLVRQSRAEPAATGPDEYADTLQPAKAGRWDARLPAQLGLIVAGLVLLVLGSDWLVQAAVIFARALGLSEVIIGLTIVASGTSLPEVAASVVASLKGERDIAVGNVVGSCVFNLFGVVGLGAVVAAVGTGAALPLPPDVARFDLWVMLAALVACLPVFLTGREIARWEGGLFLGYYVAYVAYLVLAAQRHDGVQAFGDAMLGFVVPLTIVTLGVTMLRRAGR